MIAYFIPPLSISRVRMSLFSLFRACFSGWLVLGVAAEWTWQPQLGRSLPSAHCGKCLGRIWELASCRQVFPVRPETKWAVVGMRIREEIRGARELGGSLGRGGVLLPSGCSCSRLRFQLRPLLQLFKPAGAGRGSEGARTGRRACTESAESGSRDSWSKGSDPPPLRPFRAWSHGSPPGGDLPTCPGVLRR